MLKPVDFLKSTTSICNMAFLLHVFFKLKPLFIFTHRILFLFGLPFIRSEKGLNLGKIQTQSS